MIIIDAISESALPAIAKIEAELFEKTLSLPALKSCLMVRHLPV